MFSGPWMTGGFLLQELICFKAWITGSEGCERCSPMPSAWRLKSSITFNSRKFLPSWRPLRGLSRTPLPVGRWTWSKLGFMTGFQTFLSRLRDTQAPVVNA
jgi:hypothetical protein